MSAFAALMEFEEEEERQQALQNEQRKKKKKKKKNKSAQHEQTITLQRLAFAKKTTKGKKGKKNNATKAPKQTAQRTQNQVNSVPDRTNQANSYEANGSWVSSVNAQPTQTSSHTNATRDGKYQSSRGPHATNSNTSHGETQSPQILIHALRAENEVLRQAALGYQQQLKSLKEQNAVLTAAMQAQGNGVNDSIARLQDDYDDVRQENDELRRDLESVTAQLQAAEQVHQGREAILTEQLESARQQYQQMVAAMNAFTSTPSAQRKSERISPNSWSPARRSYSGGSAGAAAAQPLNSRWQQDKRDNTSKSRGFSGSKYSSTTESRERSFQASMASSVNTFAAGPPGLDIAYDAGSQESSANFSRRSMLMKPSQPLRSSPQ